MIAAFRAGDFIHSHVLRVAFENVVHDLELVVVTVDAFCSSLCVLYKNVLKVTH